MFVYGVIKVIKKNLEGLTFVGPKKKKKQECPECGEATEHMKRHLYQSHISERWWKLLPLLACWKCEKFQIHQHVEEHGAFHSEIHGQQFFSEAQHFFDFLQQKLQVPKERILQVIRDKRLVSRSLTFNLPDLDVLDLLDQNMGLSKLEYRDAVQPTRLSSLLHCCTIFNLLLYIKNTLPNLRVEVQNSSSSHKKQAQLQVKVKGVEERKVQLKSIVVIPAEVVLPGEKENRTPFIDCHCHLDRLFHNSGHRGAQRNIL